MVQTRSEMGMEATPESGAQGRSAFMRWLPFMLVWTVVVAGLMWLGPVVPLPTYITAPGWVLCAFLMPLAAFLVPACWRIPYSERKLTWLAVPTFLAGAALAVVSAGAGSSLAWQERGQSTQAKVVTVEGGEKQRCVLRTAEGETISPELREDDGCGSKVRTGDVLSVRYDPKGGLEPTTESGNPGGSSWPMWSSMAVLIPAFALLGSAGALRMERRRERSRS